MNIKRNRIEAVCVFIGVILLAIVLAFAAVNTISISQESDYYHGSN